MKPISIPIPDFDRAGLIKELDTNAEVCRQTTFGDTSRGERIFDPAIGRQLLFDMLPTVQDVWPVPIVPSHTYARKSFHGTEMRGHIDRKGLDCSVTINVARDAPWDLEVCYDGVWHSYAMNDIRSGLVYEGRLLEHRRKPYAGQAAYQLFLHYSEVGNMNTTRFVRIDTALMRPEAETVSSWIESARRRGLNPGNNGNPDFDNRSVPYWCIDDAGIADMVSRVRDMVARVGAATWDHGKLYPVFTDLVAWDEGSELGWHVDSEHYPERAVTAICGLSDTHIGGETEIEIPNEEGGTSSINIGVGELVLYPSWVRHRVAPIQSGTRYTIACWATANESMAEFPWGEGPIG